MEQLANDVRHGLRRLARSPGFTATALVTVALGIGANTAVFSVVDGVLLRPLPYPEPERIVRVAEQVPGLRGRQRASFVTNHTFHAWRDEARTVEELAGYVPRAFTVATGDEPVRVRGAAVSPALFPLLRIQPAMGRVFSPEEDRPGADRVVLLGDGIWRERFAAEGGVIGRAIRLDEQSYSVVGVLPPGFRFPDADTELYIPLVVPVPESRPGEHRVMALPAIARLAPGVALSEAEAEASTIAQRFRAGLGAPGGEPASVSLVPLHEEMVGGVQPALLVLAGAVGLLLLITTANVAHLLLARGAAQAPELAIRGALGASRGRLARQLLTESALLGGLGGALAVGLAWIGLRVLVPLLPPGMPRVDEIGIDARVLAFALLGTLLSSLFFGTAPALRGAGADLRSVLGRAPIAGVPGRASLRSGLVVGEVALAVVLLVGAGLLLRSFLSLVSVDPGYDPANLLTARVELPRARYDTSARTSLLTRLETQLAADPAVAAVGMSNQLPLLPGEMVVAFELPGRPPTSSIEDMPRASLRVVTPGLRRALGMKLVLGRDLEGRDAGGTAPAILVNEAFVRQYLSGEDPLAVEIPGLIGHDGGPTRIVGVIADVRQSGLDAEPRPEVYVSMGQAAEEMGMGHGGPLLAVRTTGHPLAFAAALRGHLARLDSQLVLDDVRTMEQRVATSVSAPRLQASLLGSFAALALVLAIVGVYGILAYAVTQRRREIGVRIALGARSRDVLRLVLLQGLKLTATGVGVGVVLAAALAGTLESLLFGVAARDALAFAGAPLLLSVAAVLACLAPALRASRILPMETLRAE